MSASVWHTFGRLCLATALVALGAGAAVAAPPRTPAACLQAHPEAQKLRRAQRLVEARAQLLVCAAAACPDVLRRDCAQWLEEVEALLPSLLVEVRREDGAELPSARLLVDGRPTPLGPEPLSLDPGPHVVTVTAGGTERQARVVLRPGERARRVRLVFPAPKEANPEAPGAQRGRGAAYAALAVAAAGIASFAYLGTTGRHIERELHDRCAPTCTDAEVDPLRWRYRLADASLVVGAVGLGAAVYLLWPRTPAEPASGWRLGPGHVTWSRRF